MKKHVLPPSGAAAVPGQKSLWNRALPYLFILPIAITLLVFTVIPFFMSFGLSFTKYNIMNPPTFNGLYNYRKLLEDEQLRIAIKNTLIYAALVVPIKTLLALILATMVVKKGNSPVSRFAKAVFFIPYLTSASVIGVVWKQMLNSDIAAVDWFFSLFGLNASTLLGSSSTALATLAAISIWKDVGYSMIFYVAALMDVPKSYYEAAQVDGANGWQEFFRISLPMVKPTTVLLIFMGITGSFQVFELIYTLTGGGPGFSTTTIVMYAYNLNFKSNNAGYAMAVSNVLLLIVAVLSILQRKMVARENLEY